MSSQAFANYLFCVMEINLNLDNLILYTHKKKTAF